MPIQLLDGDAWLFRACGGDPAVLRQHREVAAWMPATVPGTTHGQLLAQGRIPDPYYDRNELDLQWVDQLDWEFARDLTATAADCASTRQELIFEGLDTVASVQLNGIEVGSSVNMFRQLVCDVRGHLTPGRNRLVVRLGSPIAYTAAQVAANPGNIVATSPCLRGISFGWQTGERRLTNRTWIRKIQCHFGWDWGLCLPTQGIWLPCRLECADTPRLDALLVGQRHHGQADAPSRVELTVTVALAHAGDADGQVEVTCAGQRQRVPVRVRGGSGQAVATLAIDRPRLWWPNGYGAQPLYDLSACWVGSEAEPLRRRIGLRTVELATTPDRTPEGRPAASMTFLVNGRAIYAKGADWIPPDQFVERCTPAVYRHLLGSMAEAHMNMVRVWGGGWYELDAFYDACDELGLLVWQDFMMACAIYPDTPEMIAEITAEARHQVRRLQSRACLALWCGDNEILTAVNHWWKDPSDPEAIRRSYVTLMSGLRAVVEAEDPTRRFWASSPSNGGVDADSESPDQGDVHYWKVWHGRLPFSDYLNVRPRFCTEFGFQSFAEPRTMRACVPAAGLNPTSWQMEHHQRSPEGNQLIANTIARELPIPRDFDAYCWESQINQANAIATAVEHWRRIKPWCSGALFWQVNDLWPVASWSSIDWHGRWKALQHAAKRFFAPLLVSLVHDAAAGTVAVWATSDHGRPLALKGRLLVVGLAGRVIARLPLSTALAPDASAEVARFTIAHLLRGKASPREVCLFAELSGSGASGGNHLLLVPWKHADLSRPKLTARLAAGRDGLTLHLATDRVAAFVHAEIVGTESHFDGDFAVLRPGQTYRWRLIEHSGRGQQPLTLAQARRGLRLSSLYDLAARELS